MKDVVKKIFIFVFSLFLLSCSNLFSPFGEEKEEIKIEAPALGTIRFDINKNDNLSRNAAPQAFLNGIYYRLTISKTGDAELFVKSKFQKTLSFSIPTPSWTGSSKAKLEMFCPTESQISTDDSGVVTLINTFSGDSLAPCMTGEKTFNLIAATRVFNFEIDLDFYGADDGSLKLPVTIGSTNIKSCIIVPDYAESDASKYIKAEITTTGYILNNFVAPFSDHAVFYFFEEDDDDIELSNNQLKKAKLIYSDSITVFPKTTTDKWIGIDGEEKTVDLESLLYSTFYVDGTSGDDTYGGSNLKPVKKLSAAIRKCAQTTDGGTIYLKSTPADTDTIVIDKKVKIENISSGTSKFTIPNIEIKDFSSATQVSIKGVKISKSGATGISVGNNCALVLDNVEVSGCKNGIVANDACTVDLTNSSAVKNCTGYGIQLKNSSGVLKIDGTEVNADQALTSDFDNASLFYKKAKIIRYLSVPSDSSTHDDVLNGLISSIVSFGDGAQLVFGKTTACSLTWNLKKGIVIDNSGSGTYTIKSAKDGGTIKLARSSSASDKFPLVKSASWCTWNINNVTFEGGVNTVDDEDIADDGQGGAFYLKALSSVTVNFTSCNFYKNSAVYGGAIYAEGGTVNLTDCTIGGSSTNQNIASEKGGAVYLADASSSLTFNSGTVSNNSAKNGGAIYINSYATAELNGGLISTNEATVSGGAIYQGGNLKVSGYTYITPVDSVNLNDVYLASSSKYIEVTGALSPKSDGAATGAAVLYTAAITPSTWKRGTQVLSGDYAAIDFAKFKGSESDWLTIKDTNDSNKVKLYTSYKIYVAGTGKASGIGTGKTSANGGLGTKAKPYASIREAVEQCWDSSNNGNFTIYLSGSLTSKTDDDDEDDDAQIIPAKSGSGVNIKGAAKSITLTGYTGNNKDIINRNLTAAPESGSGTALTINNTAPVTIKKIKITGGYTNGNGGGINIASGTTVKLADDVLVSGNTAKLGGGVYNAGTLFMYKNAIVGYSASSIITTYASGYTYEQAVISKGGNVATGDGAGGIYNASGTIYLGYTELSGTTAVAAAGENAFTGGVMGNYASSQGGGIFMKGGNLYMNKGNISWNKTETAGGGGVRVSNSAKMYMYGGSIKGNTVATNGGGLYVGGSETLEMSGGTIEANTGTTGGAIYNNSGGTVKLSASAYIPYGVDGSKGKGKNDVYGDNFTLEELTPPTSCTDGIVATVYPSSYAETTQMIKITAGYVYAPAISVIPQSSQTWSVSTSTGKLIKTTVMTSSNISSFTAADITSSTKYNFVIDSSVTSEQLNNFLLELCDSSKNTDSKIIGESTLDLSKTSIANIYVGVSFNNLVNQNFSTVILSPSMTTNTFRLLGNTYALRRTKKCIVPPNSQYLWSDENGVVYNKDKTILVKYPAARLNTNFTIPYSSVTTIGPAAFWGTDYLQGITMTNVTTLSDYSFEMASLTAVTIPNGVTSIPSECFLGCEYLETVSFMSNTVTEIKDNAFAECKRLKTVTLPASLKTLGIYAFRKSFTMNNATMNIPSSVTLIKKEAFILTSNLTLTFTNTSGWYKCSTEDGTYTSVPSTDMTSENVVSGSLKDMYLKRN